MRERIRVIATHYGLKNQLRQLIEECCELAIEASHSIRKDGITVNLINEIADVEIMIDQIKYLGKISEDDIAEVKEMKINRQIERMANGRNI